MAKDKARQRIGDDLDEAQRESETQHRLLIESWAQAVWETDAAGVVTADSPSWRAYTGQTLDEWLGYGWRDAIHPDSRAYAERQWRDAIAARAPVNAEFRLRAPDGGWRWTNVRAAPVLDAAGSIEKWVGMNIDIDARKRAETAVQASEQKYCSLFQSMDEAYAVVEVLKDGTGKWADFRFLNANRAFMQHTSMPYPVGRTATELLGSPNPRWTELYGQALDSSEPIRVEETEYTLGRTFDLNIFTLDRAQNQVAVLFSDITARKHAESLLRESDKRQAFLLKLSDALRPLADPAAIQGEATRQLLERLDLSRCWYSEFDNQNFTVLDDAFRDGLPSLVGTHDFSDCPEYLAACLTGRWLAVHDIVASPLFSERVKARYAPLGARAALLYPLVKDGELIAVLSAVRDEVRPWPEWEVGLVGEVAERTWAAVERARAEAARRESEERFQQFASASAAGIWIRDAATLDMEFVSPAIGTIYGIMPDALLGDVKRWVAMIVPEDREAVHGHLEVARAGDMAVHQFRIRRPADGEIRWIKNTDFPLLDADGRVQRIGGIAEDVTEAKGSAIRLEVLVNELQHRARNLLGVVTAIADRTVKQGGSVEAFEERLQALSRAQGLLSQGGSDTVDVGALVRAELAAYANGASARVGISGPDVALTAQQVQNFALAIHELTTNAVKYGALKAEVGRLAVTWEVVFDQRERRRLALSWVESDVAIEPKRVNRRGYGTELIQEALAYALQATVAYELGRDGVRCRIEMPIF